jgi:hypothetical protein
MKHMTKWLLMMLVAMLMSGCFQVERVVTVKPDGSGTLEEKVLFSKMILKSLTAAFQPEGDGEKAAEPDMYDENALKSAARGMGEGVSYVSSNKLSDEKFSGYRVVYAFKDISRLRVDKGPSTMDKKPGTAAQDQDQGMKFTFKAAKGGQPALLVLQSARKKEKDKDKENTGIVKIAEEPGKEQPSKEMDMLKGMLDGMRFSFSIVVDGKIVETNASHRDNSRIILADLDFSRVLNMSQQELARLNELKDKDMSAVMAALKDIPGMKVDMNDELRISFK